MLWMYVLVTAPTRRLTKQAVSIAAGDASVPSHVRRYDEIGLTTRALARCRELLAARGQD
jgi:HAMP domain-containing protein